MLDIIIIGGGASGLMAGISASKNCQNILLIEKNKEVGKKLLLTGGGRCNVTNNKSLDELVAHIPGNGKFLYHALSQFGSKEICRFFKKEGILLKEEDHGRIFPANNSAKTIVEGLYQAARKRGVLFSTKETVQEIRKTEQNFFEVQTTEQTYFSRMVVIATGGITYPSTGSTGDGYRFAERLGHKITELYPTEVALLSNDPIIQKKALQGIRLPDVSVRVLSQKKKVLVTHQMDVLFTHFGISGPAVLRCSTFVQKELKKNKKATLAIDCFPDVSENELLIKLSEMTINVDKSIKNTLSKLLPQAFMENILHRTDIDPDRKAKSLQKKERQKIVQLLKQFTLTIVGTLPMEKAFVTGGGVSLKEVNPKTMESKLVENLYFTGEVLDYNGYTGGYNITAALATGALAGSAINNKISE